MIQPEHVGKRFAGRSGKSRALNLPAATDLDVRGANVVAEHRHTPHLNLTLRFSV